MPKPTAKYTVTMMPEFPAWDEREGFTIDVHARSRADAIKTARRVFADAGHSARTSGRFFFRAKKVEPDTDGF